MYNLKEIHELSLGNKDLISISNNVGCFYCLKIFPKNDIMEWVGQEKTALCPHCSIDSLLPDNMVSLTKNLLKEMHNFWFENEKIE